MASLTLIGFFNPQNNFSGEILGLVAASYPLTLNGGNSFTYPYGGYDLIYNILSKELIIYDGGSPSVFYTLNATNSNWECSSDSYNRPAVLATFFTTQVSIYIRPVVTSNTIRYNWETSSITSGSYILTCGSTDGGTGGGTVTLGSNDTVYTYTGLTSGKTYGCGIITSNAGNVGNSTFFRTVTTGNLPGAPAPLSFISTLTTITLTWGPPSGTQTPPVGWYVITNSNTGAQYNTRYYTSSITLPYNGTPYTYYVQAVSDTGYGPSKAPIAGSLIFDNGINTYLKLVPGVAFAAGPYTIECWFYNNLNWSSPHALLGGGPDGVTSCMSLFFSDAVTVTTDRYGGGGQRSYTVASISLNAWHHFVLVRDGSAIETVFIDGVKATGAAGGTSVFGGQQVNNLNYSGVSQNVGIHYGGQWSGYITNMRLVVGTAVYNPTASSITVPTAPLTVVNAPDTKYLMLGAVITTDSSGTQTVTNIGNNVTQSSSLKPF